ncbi:uncharacterized protein LOC114952154 [Acropora millepora]|uniref:uncharacterized protein LOC114952154 n=1 Tax=Acropora millepora TaxID=45264 RepID=UPI001CF5EA40|nr:uncharacterized protein LOC114952154 [Acropora millepora]
MAARASCPSHLIEWIRQLYQKREGVILPVPWCESFHFQIENIFTRLRIIEKERARGIVTSEVTNMTSIFTPHNHCMQPMIVMMEGEHGMGKTTYCQKLVFDWASNQCREWDESFPRIDVILFLRCREIKYTLFDAIEDQILPRGIEPEERKMFFQFLEENPSKVLLVLDGLDEADPQTLEMCLKLIQREQLPGCYIVLTSRHEAGKKVRPHTDTLLEIVGFTTTDAERYIRKYFQDDRHLAEKLISKLIVDKDLRELTQNPLNALLLCVIFEDLEGILPNNRTQLYMEIVRFILRRYESKNGLSNRGKDLLLVYKTELMILGKTALDSLHKQELYFDDHKGDIKESLLLKFGFLSIQSGGSKRAPCDRYGFFHKSFQEFFSGYFLAFSIIDDVTTFHSILTDPRYMGELFHVFKFMSGIVAQQSEETALSIVQSVASILNETGLTSDKHDSYLAVAHYFINECRAYSRVLYGRLIRTLPLKDLDESVSFKPGTLSQGDVHLIAHELSSSWKMVGRLLNVPDAVIDQIEANKSSDSEKCYDILRRWQEMYPSDATYHRLARALQHPTIDRVDVAFMYCGPQFGKDIAAAKNAGSSVPAEIRGRGPEAERAFQKAMKSGKVKVYRGRIMLLGQDRAGKTSLKKSLLGLPFDPEEESTVGVEVDRSKCELEVDEVQNWMPSKRKKREMSEFEEELARLIVMDLRETKANDNDSTATDPTVEEVKISDELEERKDYEEPMLSSDVDEPVTDTEEKSMIVEDGQKAFSEQKPVDKNDSNELQLNINSTTLPNDVTDPVAINASDLVVRYLRSLQLEDDIKSKEVILTFWDFAGQHLYYASHSVFLSGRAVYILVYNLNKNLLARAEPCVRQGVIDSSLDNPNNETNLDNLLSWLVSVHNIRSAPKENVAHQGKKPSYLQPPVIIVGTNLDQPFEEVNTMEERIKKSIVDKKYMKHVTAPFFAVDNKTENDEGVQKLRQRIIEILKEEPYMGEEVPLRWFKFERAVDALVAKQTYFMDLDQLLSVIRQVCQIEDEEEVTAMLDFYHDLGVIVKHGQTVVLQAQWLIDLFKQLITVRPFDEANPSHMEHWRDLEVNGILRIALVDHVFSKFIDQGLCKQDILDLMELHGLIAKFSIATDENQDEQRYFVPTQLRSSPSALCEIKPSGCDPCPLVLHFLDGFVPHGLFSQLVSKFIHWCSENGLKETPQLFNNGARLFVRKQFIFALILICRKRFIKIVLKTRNPCSFKSQWMNASNKMAIEVRCFIERTLDGFSRDLSWLSNLRYELSVVCTYCLGCTRDLHKKTSCDQDDCLHLLRVRPGEELICLKNFCDETISPGWEMWFEVPHTQTMEPEEDTQIAGSTSNRASSLHFIFISRCTVSTT